MRLRDFWENQPPLVRSNFSIGAMMLGGVLLLHLIIPLLLRMLDIRQIFRYLLSPMDILTILIELLFVLLALNALRLTYQFFTGNSVLTFAGVAMGWLALVLVAGAYLVRPHLVDKYVAYSGARSFGSIHQDFSDLCDSWQTEWNNLAADADFALAEKPLGNLQGMGEVYEIRNAVMLNFGTDNIDVGLACALDGQPPEDAGRGANYKFSRIEGATYRFYEDIP